MPKIGKPRKLPNGQWLARFVNWEGERISRTFHSAKDAQSFMEQGRQMARQVRSGITPPPKVAKTFKELADAWLSHSVHRKRSYTADESNIRNHLVPFFEQSCSSINEINDSHASALWKQKEDSLSPKTIHNLLTLLRAMLHLAARYEWLRRAPKITLPRIKIHSSQYRYLKSWDEVERFLAIARQQGTHVADLYETAICTGLRQGELAALRWTDINFDRQIISVSRSFNGPTKSDEPRVIPITPRIRPLLSRRFEARDSSDLVFSNAQGKMYQPSSWIFREQLKRTLKLAGFPKITIEGKTVDYIRFHDLRHTFASLWVMSGLDIYSLQKLMGHSSIEMTMRYAHLSPTAFQAMSHRFTSENSHKSNDIQNKHSDNQNSECNVRLIKSS
jgi:integrase